MSSINASIKNSSIKTHEGAVAKRITPELQLRRLVMSCMLWENQFYVDGITIADQIGQVISKVDPRTVANIAIEARTAMNLRHVPLLIAREMARLPNHKHLVREVLSTVIQRPDELTEYLSIYWKEGKESLSAGSKKGLADAFRKFNEYSLAKYNRKKEIKLKDVLRLVHPTPKDIQQEDLWGRLINDELQTPDTWEVSLSATDGISKKDKWIRLLQEKKLGGLALLRNLRNMQQEGVPNRYIEDALQVMKTDRILPFRFIAARRYASDRFETYLEQAMFQNLESHRKLQGSTVLLVDVSGSMSSKISSKSDMTRMDAACALAMLVREIYKKKKIFSFSNNLVEIDSKYRGFQLEKAILESQSHSGTNLGDSVRAIYAEKGSTIFERSSNWKGQGLKPNRLIIFTDEQSHTRVPDPNGLAYMVNVASYKNGVGYGKWLHIDGFSEAIVDYIQMLEEENLYNRNNANS